MNATHEAPPGTYAYTLQCSGCGHDIETHTAADLTDPVIAAFVAQIANKTIIYCRKCYERHNGPVQRELVVLK